MRTLLLVAVTALSTVACGSSGGGGDGGTNPGSDGGPINNGPIVTYGQKYEGG